MTNFNPLKNFIYKCEFCDIEHVRSIDYGDEIYCDNCDNFAIQDNTKYYKAVENDN